MTNIVQLRKCEPEEKVYVKADIDNGYYRIANELGLALCTTTLSDRESRLFHAVMLKTFGFNKSMDWVCNEQLAELTDIAVSNISKVKKTLIDRQILIKDGKKIGINPVVSEWQKKSEPTKKKSKPTRRKSEATITVVRTDPHKRQDNNTKDNTNRSCPEQKSSEPQEALTNIILPLNKKGTQHQVTQKDFDQYVELYPAVDVLQAFRNMWGWLDANPRKRKTKAGIKNFINNWLSKEQNRGGNHAITSNHSKQSGNYGQQRSVSPVQKAQDYIAKRNAERANRGCDHHPVDASGTDVLA